MDKWLQDYKYSLCKLLLFEIKNLAKIKHIILYNNYIKIKFYSSNLNL